MDDTNLDKIDEQDLPLNPQMLTRGQEGEASIVEASRTPQPMSRREWTIVLLLMISVIINYIDRSNLSLAARSSGSNSLSLRCRSVRCSPPFSGRTR